MPVESPSLFAQVIQDHLELKQRNQELEPAMPIDQYRVEDPFDNHPLFKTEEQARIEETMDGLEAVIDPAVDESIVVAWPGEDTAEHGVVEVRPAELEDSGLWSRSRDFDWGD
jgi:hypothetical protein